jgi:hypothetical protein
VVSRISGSSSTISTLSPAMVCIIPGASYRPGRPGRLLPGCVFVSVA